MADDAALHDQITALEQRTFGFEEWPLEHFRGLSDEDIEAHGGIGPARRKQIREALDELDQLREQLAQQQAATPADEAPTPAPEEVHADFEAEHDVAPAIPLPEAASASDADRPDEAPADVTDGEPVTDKTEPPEQDLPSPTETGQHVPQRTDGPDDRADSPITRAPDAETPAGRDADPDGEPVTEADMATSAAAADTAPTEADEDDHPETIAAEATSAAALAGELTQPSDAGQSVPARTEGPTPSERREPEHETPAAEAASSHESTAQHFETHVHLGRDQDDEDRSLPSANPWMLVLTILAVLAIIALAIWYAGRGDKGGMTEAEEQQLNTARIEARLARDALAKMTASLASDVAGGMTYTTQLILDKAGEANFGEAREHLAQVEIQLANLRSAAEAKPEAQQHAADGAHEAPVAHDEEDGHGTGDAASDPAAMAATDELAQIAAAEQALADCRAALAMAQPVTQQTVIDACKRLNDSVQALQPPTERE